MSEQQPEQPAAPVAEPMDVDVALETPAAPEPTAAPDGPPEAAAPAANGSTSNPHTAKRARKDPGPQEPLSEVILRRLTRIKEGDTVLLRLPSDMVKPVVVQKDSLLQLGKYGSFPASELLGRHYDITYEIIARPGAASGSGAATPVPDLTEEEALASGEDAASAGGKKGGKKNKGKGKEPSGKDHIGWKNVLRPLKRQPIVQAVIDDIAETNELIEDLAESEKTTMTGKEIDELRAQGFSAEEIIQAQMARHDKFGLKTEFSKEKWRRRKEKKFFQTVLPLAPSIPNILAHYSTRNPIGILNLREDTLSQLLTIANVRPGGRYLVVDDTGGLVTAAVLERMGSEGRLMLFTDSDSPPAWGILQTMNFSERELAVVKYLNWMEADEDYKRPAPPSVSEDGAAGNPQKVAMKLRKHNAMVTELNNTRNELHRGNWDGLILATTLSPISVISRLTPYLLGSSPIVAYSPQIQVLAELLNWSKKDPNYLNDTLSESWQRTYQVLPGRTHPMMTTSATGGYLWSAIRVHPSKFQPESHQRFKRRKTGKAQGKEAAGEEEETPGVDDLEREEALEELEAEV
ncbi:hypothetical protein IAT38_007976 [Cryptococcus sp. DSM 104549]